MPDRNKRFIKKEKTNQYINETELKSLMIRINNKSFIENLSSKFKRLDKYLNKHKTADKAFRFILEKYSINCISKIITNKYKQLLLLSDDELKNFKKMIIEYNAVQRDMTLYTDEFNKKNTEVFNNIIDEFNKVLIEMTVKNKNLITRKTDSIKLEKYISKHTKSKSQKYKRLLREYIVLISERNVIDKKSYDRFGEMVLLIIRNILKKPKFSGYTYRDEFYSDSTDKILRYLKNFNHKMISKITGQEVNAFSYLSQYVHNSILFIINTKNAEKAEVEKYVNTYNENITLIYNESSYCSNDKEIEITIDTVQNIEKDLYTTIISKAGEFNTYNIVKIAYPAEYRINLEEYAKLKELNSLLNKTIQITRNKGTLC